jgi:cellulose synthase/poly-beta-1,6-N-acetylglucosamine synthase-like glycosyltransferase
MITLALLSAWLLTDLVATYGVLHYRRRITTLTPAALTPRVAILTAIKGISETTPRFLDALCQQRYPGYRLVFALESRSDPVLPLVEGLQHRLAGRIAIDIVIAGLATQRAQKVQNLLAALRGLQDGDAIVVFADADIVPDDAWLSQLIRPVANGEVAASSGYRWLLPTNRHWSSLIAAAIDMSVATAARSRHWNLCWGGSIAVERAALNQVDLPTVWDRAASDDLTLSAALRARSLKINAPLHVLVPSPSEYRWAGLLRFARRQYLLVRTYAPGHWFLAAWTLCLPTLAAAVAIRETITGHGWAGGFIFASIVLLQVRLQLRRQIADVLLPQTAISAARTTIAFARWAWPLVHLVNVAAFLLSVVGQRFTWAGIHYCLRGKAVTVERPAGEALQIREK